MADTMLRRIAKAPVVSFAIRNDGKVDAILKCWRQKANGDEEYIQIEFPKLSVEQVACIGDSARRAIYRTGEVFWGRAMAAHKRVKGEA